jgi:hypothetical protein
VACAQNRLSAAPPSFALSDVVMRCQIVAACVARRLHDHADDLVPAAEQRRRPREHLLAAQCALELGEHEMLRREAHGRAHLRDALVRELEGAWSSGGGHA